jgi:xanthosine utilization system XapX-like protein
MVIYANRSYSRSITSIVGLIGILIGRFLDIIKYIKERLANTVVILKA